MAKCVIHIGMHKTGSTSIQNSLAALDDDTHFYADIHGASNHSVPLLSAFSPSPMRHQINRARGYTEETIKAYVRQTRRGLRQSIERAGERTLLISGEGISGLNLEEIRRMKSFFERHSAEPEIVAYVRGPAGYMSSAFQQRVKSGNMAGFEAARVFPDYRRRLEKFDEVFGRDKVRLWKFDPPRFPEGSVVRDFCQHMGIDFGHVNEVRRNDSISRELAGILYRYGHWSRQNKGPGLVGGDAVALTELLRELPSTKLRIAPSVVKPIIEANRDVIDWMEARLGLSLDEEIGEDRETDIASEEDLLRPVPGAAAMLAEALSEAGIEAPAPVNGEINPLIAAFIWSKSEFEGRRLRNRRRYEQGGASGGEEPAGQSEPGERRRNGREGEGRDRKSAAGELRARGKDRKDRGKGRTAEREAGPS